MRESKTGSHSQCAEGRLQPAYIDHLSHDMIKSARNLAYRKGLAIFEDERFRKAFADSGAAYRAVDRHIPYTGSHRPFHASYARRSAGRDIRSRHRKIHIEQIGINAKHTAI